MKLIIGLILGLILGMVFSSIASSKYETTTTDASSVVGYGYNGTTILPLQVTADGKLILN